MLACHLRPNFSFTFWLNVHLEKFSLYFRFSYLSTWNSNQDEFQDRILAVLFALVELRLDCPLLALLPALVLLPLPEPALRILMKELLHWDSPFLPHRGQPCKYNPILQWADILHMSCCAKDRLLIKASQISTWNELQLGASLNPWKSGKARY